MAKIIVEEQKDLTLLPIDSILHLKVDELTIRDVDGRHGKWQKLEFKFKILGIQAIGDGSPAEQYEDVIASPIWGSVPFRLTDSAENKLRQWAEAILGIQLGVGFELDTDLFLNRECRGITTQYDKRTTNPATGQPFKAHQIDALLSRGDLYSTPAQQPAQHWSPPAQPPVQDPWASQQPQTAGAWTQQPQQPQPQQVGSWDEPPF